MKQKNKRFILKEEANLNATYSYLLKILKGENIENGFG